MKNTILDIPVDNLTRKSILEKIIKYMSPDSKKDLGMYHIVSLNPEIMVSATEDKLFKEIVQSAQVRIRDGAGIALAGKILGVNTGDRMTGVELMEELIEYAYHTSRRVLLIGGKGNLAHDLAECYNKKYECDLYRGVEGYKNILKPAEEENDRLFSIVADWTPQIVFAAFGSPQTEKWFFNNRNKFRSIVCASVGGAFNYLSGNTKRPPEWVRNIGMEWLWRLIAEPWRWRRQLRLIKFGYFILKQKLGYEF
jgi:N-acetylglucosaminyldiphosphoundecaprenol N-acetyl-beta-D-mannosaminyltransferase